jgi:hypothetical protein
MYPGASVALSIIGDDYEKAMRAAGYDEMAMREGQAMADKQRHRRADRRRYDGRGEV